MALAYGITWVLMLPLVLQATGVVSFGLATQWHGLAALGPLTAAYVMHRSRDPGFGVRDLYRRRGTGGLGRAWTVALVSTPIVFLVVALGVAFIVEGTIAVTAPFGWLTSSAGLTEFVIVCVVYGFGEEPGWRGWLLPWLQKRHNALRSTLLVSLIWAVWHAPFLVPGLLIPGGAGSAVGFTIGLVAAAACLTFLFNITGGSVLAASVWHLLWNAASLIARPSATAVTVLGMILAITGFGLILVFGRRARLGRPSVLIMDG